MRWLPWLIFPSIFHGSQQGGPGTIPFREPRVDYFDGDDAYNMCSDRLERMIVGKNGVLVSHSHYDVAPYNGSKNCFATLAAPIGYRIRIRIVKFAVNGHPNNCDRDTLHVLDHETHVDPNQPLRPTDSAAAPGPILGQLCGRITNTSELFTSTKNAMTLWWHSTPGLPANHKGRGFKILWSAFRKEMSAPCKPNHEFACGNKECIPIELACNSYADCSDDSDLIVRQQIEAGCQGVLEEGTPSISVWQLLLVVLAVAVVITCICIALCLCTPCVDNAKYGGSDSPRKEYVLGTEESLTSRESRTMPPQPPTFFPPSPPFQSIASSHYDQQRGVRRLHHSSHIPVLPSPTPVCSTTNYYRRFTPSYGPPSDYFGVRFPDPPPTVCDSEYTYVRPVDSKIV